MPFKRLRSGVSCQNFSRISISDTVFFFIPVNGMLCEGIFTLKVAVPVNNLDKNREILVSVVVNRLLKQLSNIKASEHGYFLSVTKLHSIGQEDTSFSSQHVLYPVDFRCRTFIPMQGEVMDGIVRSVQHNGIFLKCGPMNIVYLSAQLMPDYHYVSGENLYKRDDSSKIENGVVVRFMVYAVRWIEDMWRDFRVLATLKGEGLGPVSLNGLDGLEI